MVHERCKHALLLPHKHELSIMQTQSKHKGQWRSPAPQKSKREERAVPARCADGGEPVHKVCGTLRQREGLPAELIGSHV